MQEGIEVRLAEVGKAVTGGVMQCGQGSCTDGAEARTLGDELQRAPLGLRDEPRPAVVRKVGGFVSSATNNVNSPHSSQAPSTRETPRP
jgi:hypothetical protein